MAEIIIVRDNIEAGNIAASILLKQITAVPDTVLGLATGSTPLSTYAALSRSLRHADLDLSCVRGFALDEYLGVPPQHPESYRSVISREVVEPMGLDPNRVFTPRGTGSNIEEAGNEYEEMITAAGGIDVQILGIGSNGHIAFNEPGSSLASRTRIKALTAQTRSDNARFFDSLDEVPTHCITQGLGTIQEARHLLLLAFGANKSRALAAAVEGPVSATIPGSIIQLHPHVTVIVDEEAAAELTGSEYYRQASQAAAGIALSGVLA
ncbi:glucosamine-6-phosphate deaminase [Paeniglutamicibacter kerguelensis]|uniref:Glucosamine-6-phosphate deaminase n=1 Tax=Paeniglutamicibacter kerguelensis TaxID=254788 RepID=A0ABS4XJL3_9MICC|nr:glucosamine-6-phosphate deaminase [Paeniglutamicibacter kerguelensis]